jgi:hypothetical protein
MATSILAVLAALVPFLIWLWKRKAAKNDDPKEQAQNRINALHNEIASDDEESSRLRVAGLLDRVRMRQSESDKLGQGSKPS